MKKFSKLFLAIALVVCLTASAVACAKNNDDKSDDTKENDPAVTTEASGNPENPDNSEKPSGDKSGDEDPSKPGDSDKKGGFEVGNDTGEGYGQIISPRR